MVDRYRSVQHFLAAQAEARLPVIEALRALVQEANPAAQEHIKWNSPSYVIDGVDQATISAQGKDGVRLVLHRGATTAENTVVPRSPPMVRIMRISAGVS